MSAASVDRLFEAADRLGHSAHVVAFALTLVTRERWDSLCVWCLERVDHRGELPGRRVRCGGECSACPYVGLDVLCVRERHQRKVQAREQ